MEYPQVLDTIGSYWPQGLGGPHCLLNISLKDVPQLGPPQESGQQA